MAAVASLNLPFISTPSTDHIRPETSRSMGRGKSELRLAVQTSAADENVRSTGQAVALIAK